MSRRLTWFLLGLGALVIACTVTLGREMIRSQPQPGPPKIGPASSAIARIEETASRVQSDSSPSRNDTAWVVSPPVDVIGAGDLFDPVRSSAGAVPGPPGPQPLLYGVVAGGVVKSRAYIEDPVTKAVRGYQIGDTVAGWRLEQIREDRVVIAGAERGTLEVLLRDPVKPRPGRFAWAGETPEAQTIAPVAVESQRIESAPSATKQTSAPSEYRDTVPRVAGPIPSQLFRPPRKQE